MADLVVRESDGWFEIPEIVRSLPPNAQRDLWRHVGAGRVDDAADLLEQEAEAVLEAVVRAADITDVKAVSVPDDREGEVIRVWVKSGKG